jgi:phage gp46-like protein
VTDDKRIKWWYDKTAESKPVNHLWLLQKQ